MARLSSDHKPRKLKRVLNPVIVDQRNLGPLLQSFSRSNLCSDDQALASEVISAISAKDFQALARLQHELNPTMFCEVDRDRFIARRQFNALWTKLPFEGSESYRADAAMRSFLSGERTCRQTNRRFAVLLSKPWLLERRRPLLAKALQIAAREAIRILGDFDLTKIIESARPGKGSAIGTHDSLKVNPYYKLCETALVATPVVAKLYADSLIKLHWSEVAESLNVTTRYANRYALVPKDWKRDRLIAVEPSLNIWLQLGCHEVIAKRLERTGNSISDQGRNQRAAKHCVANSAVTLDLANASNSISLNLVKYLLKDWDAVGYSVSGWLRVLLEVRSPEMEVPWQSDPLRLEMFSSMGNGATFALETVIFLALARACARVCGDDYCPTVYGDDIIAGQQSALLLTELLMFCGFSINLEKSAYFGSFRESCGHDWHGSTPITPVYLRHLPLRKADMYNFINHMPGLYDWYDCVVLLVDALRGGYESGQVVDTTLHWVVDGSPSTAGLWIPFDEAIKRGVMKYTKAIQNWYSKGLTFKASEFPASDHAAYAASLLGKYTAYDTSLLTIRDRKSVV